ncbi:MAG TPA: glycosyltransferase family 9 protein [Gammaproteobacteria bacterium]
MHETLGREGRAYGGKGDRESSADAHIAVVRALHGLGDMLCAVPALAALRRAHPGAHVTLIGFPACRWLLERFGGLVDALVPFPGFPGIPEKPYSFSALCAFLHRAAASPYDLAIQMHGNGTVSNAFTALLGARTIAGLYRPGQYRPAEDTFFPYPERGSEIHRWLFLTEALRCPSDDDRLTFPVTEADREALRSHTVLGALPERGFVCVHAGARNPSRRWPAERFARVADALAERGYDVVLTGTATERPAAEAVAAAMRHTAINAAGDTPLGAAAALLEKAALLLTNDTGVSHLAASLRTPSVVVFLASDPDRWAPIDRERHRAVVAHGLVTRPLERMLASRCAVPETSEVLGEALDVMNGVYGG